MLTFLTRPLKKVFWALLNRIQSVSEPPCRYRSQLGLLPVGVGIESGSGDELTRLKIFFGEVWQKNHIDFLSRMFSKANLGVNIVNTNVYKSLSAF